MFQDSEGRMGAGRQAGGWVGGKGNSPAWGMDVMREKGKDHSEKLVTVSLLEIPLPNNLTKF